ncbi:hypothetical protein K1719_012015 [Acacia pycnantha]|nr:hypothetical protein K1719_012015 [Acacia pycnantha]
MLENRVTRCATQVWVIAVMDELGRMRFRADSDSEILKGFCWCLIWMFDDAEPEEVLTMAAEDLTEMNVGLHVKAQSKVRRQRWSKVFSEGRRISLCRNSRPDFSLKSEYDCLNSIHAITLVALMSSCNPPFLLAIRNCSYWNGSKVDVVLLIRV